MIPGDGQIHTINWRVAIALRNEQGVFSIIGGASPVRSFQWQVAGLRLAWQNLWQNAGSC
jgi:hypothetical protein